MNKTEIQVAVNEIAKIIRTNGYRSNTCKTDDGAILYYYDDPENVWTFRFYDKPVEFNQALRKYNMHAINPLRMKNYVFNILGWG